MATKGASATTLRLIHVHDLTAVIVIWSSFSRFFSFYASIIWGEPERAPNTRESGSSIYLFIYLFSCTWSCIAMTQCACSDTTCLLWLVEVVIEVQNRSAVVPWAKGWYLCYWITINQSHLSRVGTMAVETIHSWYDYQITIQCRDMVTVLS